MGLQLVTGPTTYPLELGEVTPELYGYEPSTDLDEIVEAKIREATEWFEGQTSRSFMQSIWLQTYDRWPLWNGWQLDGALPLDISPLVSVSSVKYYDMGGTLTTVSASDYWTDPTKRPPRVKFKPNSFTWPPLETGRPSAIEVRYTAGYANADAVPNLAKQGIKLLAAHWFNQTELAADNQTVSPTSGGSTVTNDSRIPSGIWSIVQQLNASGYS